MNQGPTWIAVADGGVLRIFERARRGAKLVEREDLTLRAPPVAGARDRPFRTHNSVGPARHSIEARTDPHTAAEQAFLKSVADQLGAWAAIGACERLILCAPARALGVLRKQLPAPALALLQETLDKDLTHMSLAEIAERFP